MTSVQAELRWEPSVDDRGIVASVKDGIVALAGRVPTYVQKWAADKAIKKIAGVRGIANDIEVRPASASHRTDPEIATSVVNALKSNVSIPAADEPSGFLGRQGGQLRVGTR